MKNVLRLTIQELRKTFPEFTRDDAGAIPSLCKDWVMYRNARKWAYWITTPIVVIAFIVSMIVIYCLDIKDAVSKGETP